MSGGVRGGDWEEGRDRHLRWVWWELICCARCPRVGTTLLGLTEDSDGVVFWPAWKMKVGAGGRPRGVAPTVDDLCGVDLIC